MWMILLYGGATFMETGVGVWMFGRMFPERECESKVPSKIFLILLMYTTYQYIRISNISNISKYIIIM